MIQGTTSNFTPSNPSAPTPGTKLDKNAFLQLLSAQMQYQDPMNPASQDQMFGTLTQMGVLEQITNLNTNMSSLQQVSGLTLIGREVKAVDANGKAIQGVVQQMDFSSDGTMMVIGGKSVPLSGLLSVVQSEASAQ